MSLTHPNVTVTAHQIASVSGILPVTLIVPNHRADLPPLVALHGISRNADELAALLAPTAGTHGRIVVVPHFAADRWPHFQRPCRAARPDLALLAMLAHLALIDPVFAGRVEMFGHSGGAQLAHRFAMLYPQRVARLNLAAAGWYCLPDASMAHPYGLGVVDTHSDSLTWARRHRQALSAYLSLPVHVCVGTEDSDRDDALRKAPDLDQIQGRTRVARAQTYVGRFRAAAQAHGIAPDISLRMLPGVAHNVTQALTQTDLAARLLAGTPTRALAKAS
ncbi:MAG: hypothetical protein JXQ79_06750 [Rhodobacteraceae bacterium]|nr:hypothetical protein [Paracoccaceae bacterium]